jgi:hypothetical protein
MTNGGLVLVYHIADEVALLTRGPCTASRCQCWRGWVDDGRSITAQHPVAPHLHLWKLDFDITCCW